MESLQEIREILLSAYSEGFAENWLHTANPQLGGCRPIDMLMDHKVNEVKEAAEAIRDGDILL